jgi:SAM-dependent methyltransferase
MARSEDDRFSVEWKDHCAMIHEKTSSLGFDSHYIYHTAWAARVLNETRPQEHVDISSSLYFSSIVSAFVRVKFYEFRPADIRMDGLESKQGDILSLPMPDESVASLSCMHVVEHVGLGRYGDKIDPRGDLKAMAELKRVMAKDGDLLFVVPVGRPRIMYNAHRIYSFEQIRGYFAELELREFALIPDDQPAGGLIRGASPKLVAEQEYGCGCFWFKKPG